MFTTIKEKVTSEEAKMIVTQIVISLAVGVAVSLSVHAIEAGISNVAGRVVAARAANAIAKEA